MDENEKKGTSSKTLSVRGSGSSVRMNLSHGRSKSVLIETKRKKILKPNKNILSSNQNLKTLTKDNTDLDPKSQPNKSYSEEQIDRRKKAIEAAREEENKKKEVDRKIAEKALLEKEEVSKKSEKENLAVQKVLDVAQPIEESTQKNRSKIENKFESKSSDTSSGKKFKKDDGLIKWTESGELIIRKLKAYSEWPGIYTHWNNKRIIIKEAEFQKKENAGFQKNGQIIGLNNHCITVQTLDGFIHIKFLQLEGSKIMDATSFVHGRPEFINSNLN